MEAQVALITGNHACTIGVRAMDDQHGILMDTLNELRLTAVRGSGREQVSEVLDRLIEFTRMHFWSEEQLLEKYGFPSINDHRSEHQRLLAQILQSSHRVQHGDKMQMRPLLCFLREAYAEHIEGMDREYGPWLNERGVD
jgi:hemerythrin-like metal-binding protein